MVDDVTALSVRIEADPDAEAGDLARLTSQLRRELVELDVDSVEPARIGEAPPGAKAIEGLAVDTLVIQLAPAVLGAVAHAIQAWLQRSSASSIDVAIGGDHVRFSRTTQPEERDRLIRLLEQRHGPADATNQGR